MNRTLLVLAAVAAFLVFVAVTTWLMLQHRANRVEVCMTYQGRTACDMASGDTQDAAIRTATDAACAQISGGVTESQQCTHSQPASVRPLQ